MALHALSLSPLKEVAVVVHPDDSLTWIKAMSEVPGKETLTCMPAVHVVICPEASGGMSYSIRSGLAALMSDGQELDAVVVALADQPFVSERTIIRLIDYWRMHPELDYVASKAKHNEETADVLMPPVLIASSMFEALHGLKGDSGARQLFKSSAFQGCGLVVLDEMALHDVDTPSDMDLARKHFQA
ncbi:NTP transferase domain-containing protein [Paenibacillus alkaliterrae]